MDLIKENRFFAAIPYHTTIDAPRPCSCGGYIYPVGYSVDNNDLGEPIFNSKCNACILAQESAFVGNDDEKKI